MMRIRVMRQRSHSGGRMTITSASPGRGSSRQGTRFLTWGLDAFVVAHWKNSVISGAVAAAPGKVFAPRPLSISRSVL
jgi:hypothetical protein